VTNERDLPDEDSVQKFIAALRGHSAVLAVSDPSAELTVEVQRRNGSKIRLKMTNIYCVGEADAVEFLSDDPKIDAIVTLSAWNSFTSDAWDYCTERSKGVFTWSGLFGALNYRKFWLYVPIRDDLKPQEIAAEKRRRHRNWN